MKAIINIFKRKSSNLKLPNTKDCVKYNRAKNWEIVLLTRLLSSFMRQRRSTKTTLWAEKAGRWAKQVYPQMILWYRLNASWRKIMKSRRNQWIAAPLKAGIYHTVSNSRLHRANQNSQRWLGRSMSQRIRIGKLTADYACMMRMQMFSIMKI